MAEQGVLAGILTHGEDVLAGVATALKPGDFYDRRHATVYEAMLALYNGGRPVDEITVAGRLADQGRLGFVGGAAFLAELADAVIAPRHADHYAQQIRDKSVLRGFIKAAHDAIDKAHAQQADPETALEEAESAIFAATQHRLTQEVTPIAQVVQSSLAVIEKRFRPRGPGRGATGFTHLDTLTTASTRRPRHHRRPPLHGQNRLRPQHRRHAAWAGRVPTAIYSLE